MLYLESTKRLLEAIGRWDEKRVVGRFERRFDPDRVFVIRAEGTDAGWLQVSEVGGRFHLDQIHLRERFRNRGIGSWLIRSLMAHAARNGSAVTLHVMRGNPAIALYKRLGFRIVGGDQDRLWMRWDHHAPATGPDPAP